MSSSETFRVLLRNWILIALVTILAAGAAYLVSTTRTRLYTATASEYMTLGSAASPSEVAQAATYIQNQMSSFGQLATSPAVLDPVSADLRLNKTSKDLARSVTVNNPRNTVIIQLSVTNPDPTMAAAIANAIGKQLSVTVDDVGPRLASGRPLVTVRPIETALPPTQPSSPNTKRNTGLGLIVGLALGCGIALVRSRLDTRIRSSAALANLTQAPVLGNVRHTEQFPRDGLVLVKDPSSQAAEDVRQLRANVTQAGGGRALTVLVTSSVRSEGRTTIAANLAAALGEAGRRAVLVDGDLRQPHVAQITGAEPGCGMLDVLQQGRPLDQVLQQPEGLHFWVLPAGGSHDNPSELLSTTAFTTLMRTLRERFHYVVVDSPGLLTVTDATALHDVADGALFVVHASAVTPRQVRSALQAAQSSGLRTLGVVMNDVRERDLPSGGVQLKVSRTPNRGATDDIVPSWE